MVDQTRRKRPISKWDVSILRVTTFYKDPIQTNPNVLWDALSQEKPRKIENIALDNSTRIDGEFAKAVLSLIVKPGRIDLQLTPNLEEPRAVPSMPKAGKFKDTFEGFVEIARKFVALELLPDVSRLAFAPVFVQEVKSSPKGYALLFKYLPSIADEITGAKDFLFQINRPRAVDEIVEGLYINRINQWAVVAYESFIIPAGAQTIPDSISKTKPFFALNLALDINTAKEYAGLFSQELQTKLLKKLIDYAKEICVEGDIP